MKLTTETRAFPAAFAPALPRPAREISLRPPVAARVARTRLFRLLERLDWGELVVSDREITAHFGAHTVETPAARIDVADPSFYVDVALHGALGAGESYARGAWRCDDLVAMARMLARSPAVRDGLDGLLPRAIARARRSWRALRGGDARESFREHLELGQDFYALLLGEPMHYSVTALGRAAEASDDARLEPACEAELDHLCDALELRRGLRVLELGTGWGGFAIHAARHYGVRVTTVAVADAQFRSVSERVRAAGLAGKIEVVLGDERHVHGRYDRVLSIENLASVGPRGLEEHLRRLGDLVEPHGLCLLQMLTVPDRRYRRSLGSSDFVRERIVTGASVPSVSAILERVARATDLEVEYLDDRTEDCARTLACWRERLAENEGLLRSRGRTTRFLRSWEFALATCEGALRERALGEVELVLARPLYRRTRAPTVRLSVVERELTAPSENVASSEVAVASEEPASPPAELPRLRPASTFVSGTRPTVARWRA
jgi:cyclopropane-fatty-acyl-phospholipid synthase